MSAISFIVLVRPAVEAGEISVIFRGPARKVEPYVRPLHDAFMIFAGAFPAVRDKGIEIAPFGL